MNNGQIDRSQYADARRMRFAMAVAASDPESKESLALESADDALEQLVTVTPDDVRLAMDNAMTQCGWPE